MWISTFHALCARLLRREAPHDRPVARLRHLRLDRPAVGDEAGAARAGRRRQRAAAAGGAVAHQPRQEPDGRARRRSPRTPGTRATQQIGKLYAMYLQALKDANALDFDDLLLKTVELFEKSESARARYSEKFQYVMVDEYQDTNRPQYLLIQQLAGEAPQPLRRRRSRPVDLQVARRRPAEHPRLRARLSRGVRSSARAELPLDAGDSRRRVGGHRAEPQPQGEAALHRPGGRREDPVLPRRRRPRRGRVHRAHRRARRCTRIREHRSPCSIAPTRSRARWKTRCAARASPTRSSAASGSTSARRSRTRWRTCGWSSTRTTTSACAG